MEPVDSQSFQRILASAGIKGPEPAVNIGDQLSFVQPPARTIVVQLGDVPDHRRRITLAVLSIAESWLLTTRYGSVADLGLLNELTNATAAIGFASSERDDLGAYLCERPMDLWEASADLYCLTPCGSILVTWDHHTSDEGLTIELRNVDDSNRLLICLNEVGVDLELFDASG